MAEWQIGHRKSSLVLSARFPVVKWRSRSVATSTYCSRRTSVKRRLVVGIGVGVCYTFVSFSSVFFKPRHEADGQTAQHQWTSTQPLPTPLSLTAPKNANLVLWRWVRGGIGTQFPQNLIHPGFSPTRSYGPSERDETTLRTSWSILILRAK